MEQRTENKQQKVDVVSCVTINPVSFSGSKTHSFMPGILILVRPDCTYFS